MPSAPRRIRSEPVPTPTAGVRERILDAGLGILRESGLQRLTQVQVAERAGVRQSHLTYYFPTREDLLAAITARTVGEIADGVTQTVGATPRPDRRAPLARLAAHVASLEHMRMFVGLIVEADGDEAVRTLLVDGTRQLEEVLATVLGGNDATDRAPLALAAIWGLGLYRFLVRPPPKADPSQPYLSWVQSAAEQRTRARRRTGSSTHR